MGAAEFWKSESGKTAEEAFLIAVAKAKYDYGHRGYSGTLAEKREFRMELPRPGETPEECVKRCRNDSNHWSQNKWGPAACVDVGPDPQNPGLRIFYFFGLAPE